MIKTITYYSANASPHEQWIAYVVMANGQRWNVAAFAASEQAAIDKISRLWATERAQICERITVVSQAPIDPWADVESKQHHLAGLVWMVHSKTSEKRRVTPEAALQMIESGYWKRGGPRSK